MLSKRARISPSPTLVINAKVKEMRKSGIDVIDFGIGEPDFDTPDNIKDAAISAIKSGFTKYTPAGGIDELKIAICEKFRRENDLNYDDSQIIVSSGAKYCLYLIMQSILDKGDEVIIPVPYWPTYAEQVKLANAKPIFVKTENFQLSVEKIKEAISEKTKIILINTPNNPSGAVFDKSELKEISEIAVDNNIYVISDEVYEKFVYGCEHCSIASFIKEKTIIVNGVSKTYAMTGWRIGYTAGPKDIIESMTNIQSQTTSNPTSIAQKAVLAALTESQDSVSTMRSEFDKRRKYVIKRIREIGFDLTEPKGAFYIFPDISAFSNDKIKNSMDFTNLLLEEAKVAVIPGIDFGCDNNIRISYAASMENLEKGFDRIEKALDKILR